MSFAADFHDTFMATEGARMALKDPIAVYNAATNVQAHLVQNALIENGIEAHVTEDVSTAGIWMLGIIPEIHKPQVWVEREDAMKAKPILEEFERLDTERREADEAVLADEPPVEAACEECGQTFAFPAVQRGTVQDCPHCGERMDIGSTEEFDEWGWQETDDTEEA